ncbi:MAG: hypothetical protein PHC61_07310 [Chitinivibrionales bacterium]|nr:hypothetical protein [Chitinivibrionales bacterium]
MAKQSAKLKSNQLQLCRECGQDIAGSNHEHDLCLECRIKLNNDIRILDEDTNEFSLD